MSNRTFLLESETSEPGKRIEEPALALAAGSNCIPVFWYSLFDKACLLTGEVLLGDGRFQQYPYLVSSISDARQRLLLRQPLLDNLLPYAQKKFAADWTIFVNRLNSPYVHLDAAELWMMLGPEDFQRHLLTCLEAFNISPTTTQLIENSPWLEMFDAAGIDVNNPESAAAHKLAGYAWGGQPLPWEI